MKIKTRTLSIITDTIAFLIAVFILTFTFMDYRTALSQRREYKQRFEEPKDTINKSDTYNYTEFIQEN